MSQYGFEGRYHTLLGHMGKNTSGPKMSLGYPNAPSMYIYARLFSLPPDTPPTLHIYPPKESRLAASRTWITTYPRPPTTVTIRYAAATAACGNVLKSLLAGGVGVAHAALRERVLEEKVVDHGALGVVLRGIVDKTARTAVASRTNGNMFVWWMMLPRKNNVSSCQTQSIPPWRSIASENKAQTTVGRRNSRVVERFFSPVPFCQTNFVPRTNQNSMRPEIVTPRGDRRIAPYTDMTQRRPD